jgi:hypothetical protein
MTRRNKHHAKKEFEEQVIQKFSQGCPYCDQPIAYEQFELKVGENEVQCFSCKKIFIKVVTPSVNEGGLRSRQR